LVFGGGGFPTQSEYAQLSYTHFSSLYVMDLTAETVSSSPRPSSGAGRALATEGGPSAAGVSLQDKALLHRFNRFNTWNLTGSFPAPPPPPTEAQPKNARLSPERLHAMAERLHTSNLARQQEIEKLRERFSSHGPQRPASANPASLARRLHDQEMSKRQTNRARLVEKFAPKSQTAHISHSEMDEHVTRMYTAGVKHMASTMQKLSAKYMHDTLKESRLDTEEQQKLITHLFYKRQKEVDDAKRALSMKYLARPADQRALDGNQINDLVTRLFKGTSS
jgi:hypothetical protein